MTKGVNVKQQINEISEQNDSFIYSFNLILNAMKYFIRLSDDRAMTLYKKWSSSLLNQYLIKIINPN